MIDGSKALRSAIDELFDDQAKVQRCRIHKVRNVTERLPKAIVAAEVARKHKISEQTVYNWRRHFEGLEPLDVKRLRALEAENAKLKRILAEAASRYQGARRQLS